MKYINRIIQLPDYSFFLLGPRNVGKSTWLKNVLPNAKYFDLLDSSLYFELLRNSATLEAMIGNASSETWVVIDEIQKIPALLDEVHRLIENKKWKFVLCGSSARKIRRAGVNLLGGRAMICNLESFSSAELKELFNLEYSIEWGMLPVVALNLMSPPEFLNSYFETYIKEEIKEEGFVRALPPFIRFLNIAGLLNGQSINAQNISRDAMISRTTVDSYFSVLTDTLLGYFLPAYQPKLKVREQAHPKFYWFDSGVARAAAGLLFEPLDRLWKGTALETLIFHELRTYNEISKRNRPIYFYKTTSGSEIDFIIETKRQRPNSKAHIICIEVKLSEKWDKKWEKPARSLDNHKGIHVDKMIGIYLGKREYHFDKFEVYPVTTFLQKLYKGEIY